MYGKRLKELRLEKGLFQKDLANLLNINEITYTHYENEYYIIPLKYLIILADYFNTSLNYLFNFSDLKISNKYTKTNFKTVGENIKNFRKDNKITQEDLAKILNTNRSVIANYERGRTLISTPFLYTICKT